MENDKILEIILTNQTEIGKKIDKFIEYTTNELGEVKQHVIKTNGSVALVKQKQEDCPAIKAVENLKKEQKELWNAITLDREQNLVVRLMQKYWKVVLFLIGLLISLLGLNGFEYVNNVIK